MQPLIKRLFWDIETSPNVVLSWRVGYKLNIDSDNIIKERAIVCIGYKWEHEPSAKVITWDSKQNDAEMLRRFVKMANSADELVAHNGDQFDLPWFLTRCAFHGIHTFPTYKTSDTLQWARRKLLFNSNKLNYIGKYLGLGAKLPTEFGLWKDVCLKNDRKALARMARYCARDVELLEKVWGRLSEFVPHKIHAGVASGNEKWTCPRCASEKVKCKLTRVTARGVVSKQMQCRCCGRIYTISHPVYEKYLEDKAK